MFTYYTKETETNEHYLYSSEIADTLEIKSSTGWTHSNFVSAYLNNKLEEKKEKQLFYSSPKGLRQVFQNQDDVLQLCAAIKSYPVIKTINGKKIRKIPVNKKTYTIYTPY